MNKLQILIHKFVHLIGFAGGYIDHYQDKNGIYWLGLKCPKCGKFTAPIKSVYQDKPEDYFRKTNI